MARFHPSIVNGLLFFFFDLVVQMIAGPKPQSDSIHDMATTTNHRRKYEFLDLPQDAGTCLGSPRGVLI